VSAVVKTYTTVTATPTLAGPEVLSRLGHELRGPLTAIIGLTRIMQLKLDRGPADPDQQRHHLDLITASAAELLETVERVVVLARLDLPAAAFDPGGDHDLGATAAAVAGAAGTTGGCVAAGDPVPVERPAEPVRCGHEDEVGAILTELVDNAVKYGTDPASRPTSWNGSSNRSGGAPPPTPAT
jgi:signal transduction histidine kinase